MICCYPDLDALASKAAERARLRIGLVHPHDRWWMRWGVRVLNVGLNGVLITGCVTVAIGALAAAVLMRTRAPAAAPATESSAS